MPAAVLTELIDSVSLAHAEFEQGTGSTRVMACRPLLSLEPDRPVVASLVKWAEILWRTDVLTPGAALVSEVRRTVRAMTRQNMIVKAELRHYPRGACGSPQNAWRAAFAAARLNSLGRRPQIAPTADAAFVLALRVVRATASEWADFVPAPKA